MIFRWGCEPLIINKGVQGGHDLLNHPGPLRLVHRGDLARNGGRGEKALHIPFGRGKAQGMDANPHANSVEASLRIVYDLIREILGP